MTETDDKRPRESDVKSSPEKNAPILTPLQVIRFYVVLAIIVTILFVTIPYFRGLVESYLEMREKILNPEYIRFYSYRTDQTTKVEDDETARRLWNAFSVVNRKRSSEESIASCESEGNPCLAYAAYPVENSADITWEDPIFVYQDGTVLIDQPPRRENYYHMPRFRDAVMEIISERVDADGAGDVVRGASISGWYQYSTETRLLANYESKEEHRVTYQEFLDYADCPEEGDGKWNILERWRCTSRQGYLYLLSFKTFDAYLLAMVLAPLLMFAGLTSSRRRTTRIICCLLCAICIVAGFLRTLPLYDYFEELMSPSRYWRTSACANLSIFTGFFAAALCVCLLPFRPVVHWFARRMGEMQNPPSQ
jgi:hypothetical protein